MESLASLVSRSPQMSATKARSLEGSKETDTALQYGGDMTADFIVIHLALGQVIIKDFTQIEHRHAVASV